MKAFVLIVMLAMLFIRLSAQGTANAAFALPEEANKAACFDNREGRFLFGKDGIIQEMLNERRLYSGNVRKKKLHGNWRSWYQDGQLCDSGKLKLGLPDGEWKHWDRNGQLLAIRTYSADKYQRVTLQLTRYNPRHKGYPLSLMYQQNRLFATKYLHSSYSFPQSIRRIDDRSLQQWVAANITADSVYHPVFDQSLHHGLFMNYFSNGIVKDSGYYRDGLRQGVWVQRESPDGLSYIGTYQDGFKVREWRAYRPSGQITEIIFFNHKGEEQGRRRFDQQAPGKVGRAADF